MIIILKPRDPCCAALAGQYEREDDEEEDEPEECPECGGVGWTPPVGDFDMRRCPNGCPRP